MTFTQRPDRPGTIPVSEKRSLICQRSNQGIDHATSIENWTRADLSTQGMQNGNAGSILEAIAIGEKHLPTTLLSVLRAADWFAGDHRLL